MSLPRMVPKLVPSERPAELPATPPRRHVPFRCRISPHSGAMHPWGQWSEVERTVRIYDGRKLVSVHRQILRTRTCQGCGRIEREVEG